MTGFARSKVAVAADHDGELAVLGAGLAAETGASRNPKPRSPAAAASSRATVADAVVLST